MLKLIHGADFHLDSPFSGLPPEKAALRRAELRRLPARLAELAQKEGAQLVLLSGDLFDSERIYRETAEALAQALGSIPCPVFIAPGNHDCYTPASPYAALSWPENVRIFTSDRIESVDLPELGCAVWGRAFTSPQQSASPLAGFRAPRQDGRLHLMVLHGDVDGGDSYGPITREEIAASGLDYLALGHIHLPSGLRREGDTFWAYPGCPEGRGFDEEGDRGVLCLEAEPGEVRARFVPLCTRRYRILTADITGTDPLSAIRSALPDDPGGDIYRIRLTGQGNPPDLAALEQALAPDLFGLSLKDCTRLPRGLWDRREEDSLTGLFLQLLWEKYSADPDDPAVRQAAVFGLAALERGEDPFQ